MKKQIFSILLISCALTSNAQLLINGISGSNITGAAITPTSIVIGNGSTSNTDNVIIGNSAGVSNNGRANVFVGQSTGFANTTGWANAFLGAWNGGNNTTGTANTFVGQYCGIANTTGNGNIFIGQGCASFSTTGQSNTFVGTGSAGNNTTGTNNIALGASANFSSGSLVNAIVIGANAQVGSSNSMVLGGAAGSGSAVNVGIGTSTPGAHLHTVNSNSESVIFSTTNGSGSSTVNTTAPGNTVRTVAYGNTAGGNLLPSLGALAPAVPLANMTGLLTDFSNMAIGINSPEGFSRSIHFIAPVQSSTGSYNITECMRINKTNGFVGVHTRSAASGGGTGEPKALFHVNLTNPANSNLNPLTQGIRFEGLPAANHPNVIVIDATGNLATRPYPSGGVGGDWLLTGNTTTGTEFIGTLTADDFRIYTNNTQRARFTQDGNFDLGSNSPGSGTVSSAAIGTSNTLTNATSGTAVGLNNLIENSLYSVAFGDANIIDATLPQTSSTSQATGNSNHITESQATFVAGLSNQIVTSNAVAALGGSNHITNTNQSGTVGEDNTIVNGHGVFVGGGHNYAEGYYSLLLGNRLRAEITPTPMPTGPLTFTSIMAIGEQINSDLSRSLSVGFSGNRTMVTTKTGVAVQLDPTALSTYAPTVNFEVEAGVTTTGPMPLPFGVRSNIRFHNLPVEPYPMPAVVIDPTSGELFQTTNVYKKEGNSGAGMDSLYSENAALKARVSELESQLAGFDAKFASLEASIRQVCETGCAGLNTRENDVLYQSIPNPGTDNVMINYYLSRNYTEASISLYSLEGKMLQTYPLTPNKGNGFVNITVAEMLPGMYVYKLVVDGKQVGVQKMQKR